MKSETRSIYVSTACLAHKYRTLDSLLDVYQAHGLNCVELGHCGHVGPNLELNLKLRPLRYLIHNYFPPPNTPFVLNLASGNRQILEKSKELVRTALELSAKLSARFYSVHAGFCGDIAADSLGSRLQFDVKYSYQDAVQTFLQSISELSEEAHTLGIELFIEPNVVTPVNRAAGATQSLLFTDPDEIGDFLMILGRSNVRLLLDLGHLNVTAATLGYPKAKFVDCLGKFVGAFHLHENDGRSDQHKPATRGSWAWDLVHEKRFRHLPIIVEARFDSVDEMSVYENNLSSSLTN